jgi:hypothetical protein
MNFPGMPDWENKEPAVSKTAAKGLTELFNAQPTASSDLTRGD